MAEVVKGKKYGEEPVVLDGKIFFDCTFKDSTLLYGGGQLPSFDTCTFDSVKYSFIESAGNTMMFLRTLYSIGYKEMVERTFEDIKSWTPDPSMIDNNKSSTE